MPYSRAVRWLAGPMILAASISFGAPKASSPAEMRAASLKRLSLNGTPAALSAALGSLSNGVPASRTGVNRAQSSASVSGVAGQINRVAVPLGDTTGDAIADVLDVRATGKTLTYQMISGRDGMTFWRATAIQRRADIFAAVFPAAINAGARDFYLLEQYEIDASLTWTLHAVDGATGVDIWTTTGSLPTGVPPAPQIPPSVPPSIPPVGIPTLPSIPPSIPPVGVPSPVSSAVPSIPPSLPPSLPPGLPSVVPVPNEVPTPPPLPNEVPSPPPVPSPSVGVTLPPVPNEVPVPSPSPSPGAGRRSAASTESKPPFAAYITGAKPVDVDGDGFAEFPLSQHIAVNVAADNSTTVVSMLSTVNATSGSPIASVVGVGRNAIPSVTVSGDFLGQGRPGFLVADEVSLNGNSVVTYRGFSSQGFPAWVQAESVTPGFIASYDASADLSGDGLADVLTTRIPVLTGTAPTLVTARTAPLGLKVWERSLEETAIATIAGALDATAGADVVTQGLKIVQAGQIPTSVVYRGLGGVSGVDLYSNPVPVANGGALGDWSALLAGDAGTMDADATPDLVHAINAVPSGGQAALWSQAAVSAKTGRTLWKREGPLNPGAPARGDLVADTAADIVDVQESATRTSDSLVVKTASGADGSAVWSARVLIGGGTERVRSLVAQATTPQGAGDLLLTVVQKSGTGFRSLLVMMKGSTGQVIWIRTT